MFTRFETEENDVFSCNICDGMFVSEASIRQHIVEAHQEEDFEDPGPDKNVKVNGLNISEKENNERQGQDGDQPWWLDDIFHVCDICYEIFSNSPRLRDHQRLEHSGRLECNGNTGETTGAKDERDERRLTVNTNILNTNSQKTKLLKSKITRRPSSISKKEALQPRNVQQNPPTAVERDVGEERSSCSCFKCGLKCKSLLHRKNHILSHYYSAFYSVLPSSNPYVCPQCGQTSRDRITLIRHFAFSHKQMYQYTGVTEDLLLLK